MRRLTVICCLWIGVLQGYSQSKNDCPDFKKAKAIRDGKKPKEGQSADVKLLRGKTMIKFNVIKLGDRKLEIPAFKQFKNNMTDFTADGEEEFKRIVEKLRVHFGPNTTGEGAKLEIIGSASQIPTSFDPSKPNNNIHADGTSLAGKTTIENNKLLALARATELGNKIKRVFPDVELSIPSLSEIELGATPWNDNAQKRLNAAVEKKDAKAIDAVYAPYQKEQYVMVRTRDYKTEFIQPEAVYSAYINISPPIAWMDEGGKYSISHFVVSEGIYNKIGGNKTFDSVEERDEYLKNNLKINVFHKTYAKAEHWFMLTGKESLSFRQKEDYKKIKGLYRDKVFDLKDRQILEDIIVAETLQGVQ